MVGRIDRAATVFTRLGVPRDQIAFGRYQCSVTSPGRSNPSVGGVSQNCRCLRHFGQYLGVSQELAAKRKCTYHIHAPRKGTFGRRGKDQRSGGRESVPRSLPPPDYTMYCRCGTQHVGKTRTRGRPDLGSGDRWLCYNGSVLLYVHTLQIRLSCVFKKRCCFDVGKDVFAREVRGFQEACSVRRTL